MWSWCEAEAEAAAELQSWPDDVPTVTEMERWKGRPRGTSESDAGDSWCDAPNGGEGKYTVSLAKDGILQLVLEGKG